MMRSTDWGASCVCRVANTRWPVSAAVSAVEIVSRSRISPTRMTSGSWRRTCLRADANEWVSSPTSRWLTTAILWLWRNSIGSSTVMMWHGLVALMMSTSDASVVDLPEPVGPVTSTRPRGRSANCCTDAGKPERLEGHDLERDGPHDGADRVALQEDVHAEAADLRHGVRRVELEVGLELLPLLLGEDGVDHPADLGAVELRELGERLDLAVDTHRGVDADGQVEVGAAEVDDPLEQVVDVQLLHRRAVGRGHGRDGHVAVAGRQGDLTEAVDRRRRRRRTRRCRRTWRTRGA